MVAFRFLPTAVCCFVPTTPVCGGSGPRNLLKNGSFEKDAEGWSLWFAPGQAEGEARWVRREQGGALEVSVRRTDRQSAVQIYQDRFRSDEMGGIASGSKRGPRSR